MPASLATRLKNAIRRPNADVHPADMEWVGIRTIMRTAKFLNTCRFGRVQRLRRWQYRMDRARLYLDNGESMDSRRCMTDGVLLDTSLAWPHLASLLTQCESVIAANGMSRRGVEGREWIRDIMVWSCLETHPALLDFVTSSDVVRVASEYLGYVPSLSTTVPPGLRLTESHTPVEEVGQRPYRGSQLFHMDIHDGPMVYVIVLVRDVTDRGGPFRYLPASASARVVEALRYQDRGRPFRLTDEEVYSVVDPDDVQTLSGRAGTVLFLDPSRCLHYGSRDSVVPRYQAMYALVSPCRADFTEWYLPRRPYPRKPMESGIRRLVLDGRASE